MKWSSPFARQPNESALSPHIFLQAGRWLCLALVTATEALVNLLRYRSYCVKRKQQRISALRDWIEAIFFVLFVMLVLNQYLGQLFVIPSGSMIPTLQERDRVFVNKMAFGIEPYPFGPKLFSKKKIERGTVIPFISPEYRRPGTLFLIAQRIIFYLTFTKVDLDVVSHRRYPKTPVRLASQPMLFAPSSDPYYRYNTTTYQPPLLVKRVVAVGGDRVRFVGGEPELRLAGADRFTSEVELKRQLGLDYESQRDIGVFERPSFYAMDKGFEQRVRSSYLANPHNIDIRSRFIAQRMGDAIPPHYFEPFGDNRDHSHDGRWFGILNRDDLQGRVSHIVAPFRRFRSLDPRSPVRNN